VLKAIEKDRSRRYETANALAMDVERYLHDEPVLACPPTAVYRIGKFIRRNRNVLLPACAFVVLLVASVIGLTLSNLRISREKNDKEEALAESEANLSLARHAVDEMYTQVAAQLDIQPEMQPFQRDVFLKALRFYQEFAKRKSNDPTVRLQTAHSWVSVGSIQTTLGQHRAGERACCEAILALEQLIEERPSEHKPRIELARAYHTLGGILGSLGRAHQAELMVRKGVALYDDLIREGTTPNIRLFAAATYSFLATRLLDRPQEAERYHRQAIRLSEDVVAESPGNVAYRGAQISNYYLLGHFLYHTGRLNESEEVIRQTITLFEKDRVWMLRSTYRGLLPEAQDVLGKILTARGQNEEADKAYRQAIDLTERFVDRFPDILGYQQNLAAFYEVHARLLTRMGRVEEATATGRAAGCLYEKLGAANPDDPASGERLLTYLTNAACLLRDVGDIPTAEKLHRKALECARKLEADSPNEVSFRYRLAVSHGGMGIFLQKARRGREAAREYRQQLAIFEQLVKEFPDDPDYRYSQARAGNFLGILLRYLPKEAEAALTLHQKAITICDRLVVEYPETPRFRVELVRSHYSVGLAAIQLEHWSVAEESFRQALAAGVPLEKESAKELCPHLAVASIHNDWAWLLATCPDATIRDAKRAVEYARKAVELDPAKGGYWNTLGVAEYRAANYKEAIAALEKSMKLRKGGDSFDWFFLAMICWHEGENEKAREWYKRAVTWMKQHQPKDEELLRFCKEAAQELKVEESK
jgi:tetratricopeptide (TPR) repeat protein